jgi:hypothetical protein
LAEAVVRCLSLSREASEVDALRKFSTRDWERAYNWLDDSGLTLYLFQRLKTLNAAQVLPPAILARFEQNLVDNRRRLDRLAHEFASLNHEFERAGVEYAVVKGFSLEPTFCSDTNLRSQSDLDYLVTKQSLAAAQRVLDEAQYCLKENTDNEWVFWRPPKKVPSRFDSPYSEETEALVELHLALWEQKENCVPLAEPQFAIGQTKLQRWRGLSFPVLTDENAFVRQVLHVFYHMLACWMKLSWLFEVGYFLQQQSSDRSLWQRIDVCVREIPYFSEYAAVVIGLAVRIFAAPVPDEALAWMEDLRPAARLWLDRYGRSWAFVNHPFGETRPFPATKLALFLHEEFVPDPRIRSEVRRRRLIPWKRPTQVAFAVNDRPSSILQAGWRQWEFVLRRPLFHAGTGLRYLWEIPGWRRASSASKLEKIQQAEKD